MMISRIGVGRVLIGFATLALVGAICVLGAMLYRLRVLNQEATAYISELCSDELEHADFSGRIVSLDTESDNNKTRQVLRVRKPVGLRAVWGGVFTEVPSFDFSRSFLPGGELFDGQVLTSSWRDGTMRSYPSPIIAYGPKLWTDASVRNLLKSGVRVTFPIADRSLVSQNESGFIRTIPKWPFVQTQASHSDIRSRFALDVVAGMGSPIYAPVSGTVAEAEDRFRDLGCFANDSKGRSLFPIDNWLTLYSDDGVIYVFSHLMQDSVSVRPGDRVVAGQQIARLGRSGTSGSEHLHFQAMLLTESGYVGVPMLVGRSNGEPVKVALGIVPVAVLQETARVAAEAKASPG